MQKPRRQNAARNYELTLLARLVGRTHKSPECLALAMQSLAIRISHILIRVIFNLANALLLKRIRID